MRSKSKGVSVLGTVLDITLYRFLEKVIYEDGRYGYVDTFCKDRVKMRTWYSPQINRDLLQEFLVKEGYMKRVFKSKKRSYLK